MRPIPGRAFTALVPRFSGPAFAAAALLTLAACTEGLVNPETPEKTYFDVSFFPREGAYLYHRWDEPSGQTWATLRRVDRTALPTQNSADTVYRVTEWTQTGSGNPPAVDTASAERIVQYVVKRGYGGPVPYDSASGTQGEYPLAYWRGTLSADSSEYCTFLGERRIAIGSPTSTLYIEGVGLAAYTVTGPADDTLTRALGRLVRIDSSAIPDTLFDSWTRSWGRDRPCP